MKKRLGDAAWGRLGDRIARLLDSGVPLLEALSFLAGRGNQLERAQVEEILDVLHEGRPLSDALASGGAPLVMQTLVEVGEHQGDLAGSLFRSAAHCAEQARWRRERMQAMSYPIVVCLMLAFVTLFLFSYVIPRFASLYAGMGLQVKGPTASLFMIAESAPVLFGSFFLGTACLILIARKSRWRTVWERLPLVRRWVVVDRTHEWTATLGMLLDGGLPLMQALEVQTRLPIREESRQICQRVRDQVLRGGTLSEALAEEALEESLALAVEVAEVTGDLPRCLLAVERELADTRKRMMTMLIKWLEPVLLTMAGLMVGLVALCMLWPMLDLVDSI